MVLFAGRVSRVGPVGCYTPVGIHPADLPDPTYPSFFYSCDAAAG
jgi:hypothetical protein